MLRGALFAVMALSSLFSAFSWSSAADGVVFWNDADKHADIGLSVDGLSISVNGGSEIGVRSNRGFSQGEGYYYFEISSAVTAVASIGVVTASQSLDASVFQADDNAIWRGNTNASNAVIGVAVDYRGLYPVVHFLSGDDQSVTYQSTVDMQGIHEPVYIFISSNNASGGFQHTLNLGATSFVLDYDAGIQQGVYRGNDGIEGGWPTDDEHPTLTIVEGNVAQLAFGSVDLTVNAQDAEDGDVSASVLWLLNDVAVGSGASITVSPPAGTNTLTALAIDSVGNVTPAQVTIHMVVDDSEDQDYDGFSYAEEIILGSNPAHRDTDKDGLADNEEVLAGTSLTNIDSDADGMTDGYEVENLLNPLVDDAASDLDGDSFSNLAEFLAGRSANNSNDYPGQGVVELNSADANAFTSLLADGVSVTVSSAGVGAVRSDVVISSGSGWHYFEGTRSGGEGQSGFGVASSAAALDGTLGADAQSLIVSSAGDVVFNGVTLATFTDADQIETVGIAVDYSGAEAVAHVMASTRFDDYQVFNSFNLGAIGDLHILAWGSTTAGETTLTINAGADKSEAPFAYSARYLLHRSGFSSAEFMRDGWGNEHVYTPVVTISLENEVFFVKDENVNPTMTISADKLGVSFKKDHKSAILANQGMIGEFWYWEAHRDVGIHNIGFGMNNPYAYLDPYCCVNQGLEGAPPSMSINALGAVWQNLQYQYGYPRQDEAEYYGYAVDYRGTRPIVYIISLDGVVGEMLMDDFITPIYPQLYGEGIGEAVLINSGNFGTKPFYYNASQALEDYGVDVSEFRLGWGVHQTEEHQGFAADDAPVIAVSTVTENTLNLGESITLSAIASDFEDGDISGNIIWTEQSSGTIWLGGSVELTLANGTYQIIPSVTDSASRTVTGAAVNITVLEPVAPDTDGDGVNDAVEAFFGTDPTDIDSDDDGLTDGEELLIYLTNPLSTDTDADGMDDLYEVNNGLDALSDDSALDVDLDGFTNLEESVANSNALAILSYPGSPFAPVAKLAAVGELFDPIAAQFDGTTYNLSGSGTDFNGVDEYQFVYEELQGDGEIIARVTGLPSGSFAKAGVMIRDSLDAGAIGALAGISPQGGMMYLRSETNGTRTELFEYNAWFVSPPYFVRITRDGDLVSGHRSADGITWDQIFSQTLIFTDSIYMGLFVSANDGGTIGTATFDTVSFVEYNDAPVLSVNAYESTVLLGDNVDVSASASDTEDGDITSSIAWTNDLTADTANGASYVFEATIEGVHTLTAQVADSKGVSTSIDVTVNVVLSLGSLDNDNDGLSADEEAALGTDPEVADTDGDGLIDGDEVNIYGSDPLSTDGDADGLPDAYEVAQGYDPAVADSGNDADLDGVSNLDEYLAGTDPQDPNDYPGAPVSTLQNSIVVGPGDGDGSYVSQINDYTLTSNTVSIDGTVDTHFVYTTLPINGEAVVELTGLNGGGFTRGGLMIRDSLNSDAAYAYVAMTENQGSGMFWVDSQGGSLAEYNEWNGFLVTEPYWLRLVRTGNSITGYHSADAVNWSEIATVTVSISGDAYIGLAFNGNNGGLDATATFNDFELTLNNNAPVLTLGGEANVLLLGNTLNYTALAIDVEDGDITASVQWSDGTNTATGSAFDFTPVAEGSYLITATVTDSLATTTVETSSVLVVSDLGQLDDDNDGLSTNEEIALGTDPAIADTDGDGLLDGDEVNTHGSDPLLADTDADGMPDDYEVLQGYNPVVDDGAVDSDGDGVDNLGEYLGGTDPLDAYDYPGAPVSTLQDSIVIGLGGNSGSYTSQINNYALTSDTVSIDGEIDVQFVYTTLPINGEAIVNVAAMEGGGFTRSGLMIRDTLDADASYAFVAMTENQGSGMFWVDTQGGARAEYNSWNGYLVTEPYWLRLVRDANSITGYYSADAVSWTEIATVDISITGDAYIGIGFNGNNGGLDATAQFNDFALILNNNAPVVTLGGVANVLLLGNTLNYTASAIDAEDGDISASVEWSDGTNTATGSAFNFTPVAEGDYLITATVTDSLGEMTVEASSVLVVSDLGQLDDDNDGLSTNEEIALGTDPAIADTDGDGLLDGDEVNTHGSDPLLADTDGDGMPDDYEVLQGYNPVVNDSSVDSDGDGVDNLGEYLGGTDPTDPYDYPGAPVSTLQDSIVIGLGGNSGSYTSQINNYSLTSDSISIDGEVDVQFVYTTLPINGEAIVNVAAMEGGGFTRGGLMIRDTLDADASYAFVAMTENQGSGMFWVDTQGGARAEYNSWNGYLVTEPYWLRLVRDGNSITGYYSADAVSWTEITTVTISITGDAYIGVGFNGNNGGLDATAQFNEFDLSLNNDVPVVTLGGTANVLLLGETLNYTASAIDSEDGDISASVEWSDGTNSATGAAFDFTPVTAGDYLITATVTDSLGGITVEATSVLVVTNLGELDDDNDGLSTNEEGVLGTDPAIADTDGDGLIDGDEVNTYGTDPLSSDTDLDGLPDAYEVQEGFDPTVADSSDDADLDGVDNLNEYLAGTNPHDPYDYPGAPTPFLQSSAVIGLGGDSGSFTSQINNYSLTSNTVSIDNETDVQFVYTTLATDGEAIVRVSSLNGGSFTRGGLMIRDTLDADSSYAFVAITEGKGTGFFSVATTGGVRAEQNDWNGWYVTEPYWLRLVRSGNTITGYSSEDAVSWTEITTVTVSITGDAYIGIGFNGNNGGLDATAQFNEFDLITP